MSSMNMIELNADETRTQSGYQWQRARILRLWFAGLSILGRVGFVVGNIARSNAARLKSLRMRCLNSKTI
jgi:hypothetical protein